MTEAIFDQRILDELKVAAAESVASGRLPAPNWIDEQTKLFHDTFGPDALRRLDGAALLQLMHGRQGNDTRCLAYWLEFKNDDEFASNQFGGIRGGSALKFGIFQRDSDGAWMAGAPQQQAALSLDDAIAIAQSQRDELVAGADVLAAFDPAEASDAAYAQLQTAMQNAAPKLFSFGWSHKYWFLNFPDKLDGFHNPRYQRFHLLKLLQLPPDNVGIRNPNAQTYVCAGRFVKMGRQLSLPVAALCVMLNQRNGTVHRYWKIGTTAGSDGDSEWATMRDGSFVSIGWPEQVPDLSRLLAEDKSEVKEQIKQWLLPSYGSNSGVASRKAGEITNFAREMSENDIVLACEGQSVLGIGRITGAYEYESGLSFPHKRPVEWLSLIKWSMPESEGPRTTVFELGKSARNILAIEQVLAGHSLPEAQIAARAVKGESADKSYALPPLDPFGSRVDNILRRKGQIVLYGPPGTGKTYRALQVARELAARHTFRKSYSALSETELAQVNGSDGFVRICTFHPGWGYEDFVEGLRPKTNDDGLMVFEPQDGTFKRLCRSALDNQERQFFLIIDEINRGDLPRIFGELLTTIEIDKRDTPVTLPVTRAPFAVPRNVFILGTMNTADRSISLMDVALRRRFGFIELMPDSSLLANRRVGGLSLGAWLDALNARLRQSLKRDARNLQIGHAYLMPSTPITSVADFARVLRDDIIPLLEEYCYDDFGTLRDILGSELVDVDACRIREEMFLPNRDNDLIQAVSFKEMQPLVLYQDNDDALDSAEDDDDAVRSQ
ncbi:AAA family ATPase [Burkholderia gladioli]|uniref:AAA family ATPase n=1 Tax=Burkholderia gladioli TaxID=28095 RepID=UPI001C5E6B4A|nr:AAA family ATPase [Burkholderia gladioli]MBW5286368.1 AAA family ATPase [Burkholderia gladioli]